MRLSHNPRIRGGRVARAFIIGLAATLVLGGVTGLAYGPEAEHARSLPPTFTLADRSPNDRVLYNLTVYNATSEGLRVGSPTHPAFELRWTEPRLLPDRNGTLRPGEEIITVDLDNRRSTIDRQPVLVPSISAFDLSGEPLYRGYTIAAASGETRPSGPPGILQHWNRTQSQLGRWYPEPGQRITERSCLAENLLQGKTTHVGGAVRVFGECSFPLSDLEYAGTSHDWIVRGTDQVRDQVALVFESRSDQRGRMQVWFTEVVAYPLKVVLEDKGQNPRIAVYELAEFNAGAPTDVPLPQRVTAPAARLAPLTPWILDDTGVSHAFPLSEAFVHARDDPEYPGLREFLREHPEAYLRFAQHTHDTRTDNSQTSGVRPVVTHEYAWQLVVAQGAAQFAFEISKIHRGVGDQILPWGYTVPETVYDYMGFGFSAEDPPPKRLLPAQLPHVASLLSAWPNHAGPLFKDRQADAWGFIVTCGDNDCSMARVTLHVGIHDDAFVDCYRSPTCFAGGTRSREFQVSELSLGADLAARSYTERRALQEGRHDLQPLSQAQRPAPNQSAPNGITYECCRDGPIWAAPDPLVGTAISAAGILIALAYLFWPVLKQISWLGLFSRIQRPSALDHPARSQIHLVVQNNPGTHFLAIARQTGLARGQVEHHLRKLIDTGLVTAHRTSGFTCFFAAGETTKGQRESAAFLKADGAQRIRDHVRTHPGTSLSDTARALGLSVPTVKYHVDRLRLANVIHTEAQGRRTLLFVAAT